MCSIGVGADAVVVAVDFGPIANTVILEKCIDSVSACDSQGADGVPATIITKQQLIKQ